MNDYATQPDDQDEIDSRLEALAESLLKKRDDAIEARATSGIEKMWREAQMAFDGVDATVNKTNMLDFATGDSWIQSKAAQPRRSKVIVNIIRGKCETAEGRFFEIMLPSDDKNWGLLNTKVPENASKLPQQAGIMAQQGQPQESQKDALEVARGAMEEEIEDQLGECGFNAECRKVGRSAIRLGTGILKGPNVIKSTRRAWIPQSDDAGNTVHVMETVENLNPASKWVDCWNVYPDRNCGTDAKKASYIWERGNILPREIKNLAGVPGYNRRQLSLILQEQPVRNVVTVEKGGNQKVQNTRIEKGAPYEMWTYSGDVDREDMIAMGCDCPDELETNISACIVFINDRPVKAVRNMLDTGELPYDFFQWVQSDNDSPWGMGEPHKIIWQQRIITAAWRAMMDNAGDSSGAMVVMNRNVYPEDDVMEITGKKIFIDESEDGDVSKSFAMVQILSNQQDLQRIIELALKFTDLESGTPAILQGEKASSPETLGGMELLVQGADTTRRAQVKQWDDQITRPHIGRYYHWNMQYNDKQEIKGDFEVDARGTSVLISKDQTAQRLMNILNLRGDPEVNIQVDWGKCIRQLFQSLHLDVLKSDEEVEAARQLAAQQPPPADPAIEVAKIRAEAQIRVEQLQAKEAADHAVAQAHLSMQQQQFDAMESEKDRQMAQMQAEIDNQLASAQLSSEERRDLEKQKVLLASLQMRLAVQERMADQSIAHQKDVAVAGHQADLYKHKNPQVAQPAVEPAGKAPQGEAFAK